MTKQVLVALALMLFLSLGAQVLSNFGADFERTLQTAEGEEHSFGKIRMEFPNEVIIFVEEPLEQWLYYSDGYFLVHYPEQQTSYRISKKVETAPHFISTLIAAVKEDFGLSGLGFTIHSVEVEHDTLKVLWQAPETLSARISRVELLYIEQALVESKSYNMNNDLVIVNSYSGHIPYHGYQIPLKTINRQISETGERTETIAYQNPEFNADYSALLNQFRALERELTQTSE